MELRGLPVHAAVDRNIDTLDPAAAAPGQSADLVQAGRSSGFSGQGKVITDFASISQVNPREVPSGIRVGVFRGFLAGKPRLVAELDPAQPFDVDVALPAGDDEPQRVALFGPQRFAVLRVDHEAIVEAFVERKAAGHVRAVRAFDQRPFGFLLDSGFVEQRRKGTPVHSAQPIMPWLNCSEFIWAARHSMPPLAGHSMK